MRCHIGRIAHAHMHIARIVSYSASAAACRYAAVMPHYCVALGARASRVTVIIVFIDFQKKKAGESSG